MPIKLQYNPSTAKVSYNPATGKVQVVTPDPGICQYCTGAVPSSVDVTFEDLSDHCCQIYVPGTSTVQLTGDWSDAFIDTYTIPNFSDCIWLDLNVAVGEGYSVKRFQLDCETFISTHEMTHARIVVTFDSNGDVFVRLRGVFDVLGAIDLFGISYSCSGTTNCFGDCMQATKPSGCDYELTGDKFLFGEGKVTVEGAI